MRVGKMRLKKEVRGRNATKPSDEVGGTSVEDPDGKRSGSVAVGNVFWHLLPMFY